MSFLKNIFGKKDEPIKSYSDFWTWFQNNEKDFFAVVKNRKGIEKGFFDKLSPKLGELKDGYFYLTGMFDDNTVELVLTAEGNTRNIAFVEELPGANTQGESLHEARENLAEAVELVMEANRTLSEESLLGKIVIREPFILAAG